MLKSYIRSCRSITQSLKSGLVNLLLYCFSMLKSYIRSCRSITHSLKSGLVNLLLYCFSMLKSYIRSCRLDLSLTSLILLPPICTLRARDVYLQNIGYQVLYASFFPCSLPQRKHLMYFKIFIEFYIEIRYQVL